MAEIRQLTGRMQRGTTIALAIVAIAMLVYHLAYTQILLQDPEIHVVTHLGLGFVVVFLSLMLKSKSRRSWFLNLALLVTAVVVTGYYQLNYPEIVWVHRTAFPYLPDLIIGSLSVVLAFIVSYLVFGKTFPIVAAVFIAYLVLGRYLPFPFKVVPMSAERIIMWLGALGFEEGIFGDILGISANYLFMFIVFGGILHAFGGLRFIINVGQWVGAKLRSGPAAVAIIGSSLLGTITGSTTANITITGAFTIPLMKESGYTPNQAGAIEASASNGGQIMPPIMGATAFVMAGFTGIPYVQIIVAAFVPALLYYFGLFLYAEITARKMIIKAPKMEVNRKQLLLDAPIFVLPIGVLVFLLIEGFSLPFVAFWSMVSIIVIGLVSSIRKEARLNFREVVERVTSGVRAAAEVAVVCALIGVVATCIKVSGLGIMLPLLIEDISGGHLIIALLIGMVASILLGMGVPTIVAYLLVAIGLVPALIRMGVPLLPAHMFPFIFAVFSHLTPPVAFGALIASRIAGGDYWRTSGEALKAAFTAFLLPFFIIYAPVLILRPEGGVILPAAQVVAILLGIVSLQMGISNYCFGAMGWNGRFALMIGAIFCLLFVFTQDYLYLVIGAALSVVIIARYFVRRRRHRAEYTPE